MGQQLYERPREKLINQGVKFLTTRELLQIIIGSGSATVSAAHLAKIVEKILTNPSSGLKVLTAVKGLGEAKACQLLSAVELGRRMAEQSRESEVTASLDTEVLSLRSQSNVLLCIWFDGAVTEISRQTYKLSMAPSSVVRAIFAETVKVSARSMKLYLGKSTASTTPDSADTTLLGSIRETSRVLQVNISDIIVITKTEIRSWRHEV